MLSQPERFAIADAVFSTAERIASGIAYEPLQNVINFLQRSSALILPKADTTFAQGWRLRPHSPVDPGHLVRVYVYHPDDLAALPPRAVKDLALRDLATVAMYYPPTQFLMLRAADELSPFMQAHLFAHEGFHAWSHQVGGHAPLQHDWDHERDAHQFEHACLARYGGAAYERILRRHIAAIHDQARRSGRRPGDTYFTGWPYDVEIDGVMGPSVSDRDRRARMRTLNLHALFTIIEEDRSELSGPWQTALLKFVYEHT